MVAILDKILRAGEGRALKQLARIADAVNSHEATFSSMSDSDLRGMTVKFRERLAGSEDLDDLLPEAFAVVREASKRTLGQRHYDVQIMGGAALHLGNIAEMRTGEGKTLVATLPSYLNALTGRGVHIVTTNDYLAERDSEWMGRIHRFLGLKVGVILASMSPSERRENYAADITYGTNNEFGFDYLRDNMAWSLEECVQREHNFAIVDEVGLVDDLHAAILGHKARKFEWHGAFAGDADALIAAALQRLDETLGLIRTIKFRYFRNNLSIGFVARIRRLLSCFVSFHDLCISLWINLTQAIECVLGCSFIAHTNRSISSEYREFESV